MASPTRPAPGSVVQAVPPTSRTTSVRPFEPAARRALEQRGAGETGHERIDRRRHELGCSAVLQDVAVHDHADPVCQRGGVLEIVGDEDRRLGELAQQLVQLDPDRGLRVGVEGRQWLIEQEDTGLERQCARERDALALSAGEVTDASLRQVRDLEALEQVVHRCAPRSTEPDVREDVEMRKQGVLLEEVAHPASLGRHVDACRRVEPRAIAERDDAAARPKQSRDDAQDRRLPAPERSDERNRVAVGDGQLDGGVEATKGMGEVEFERHRVRSLTEKSVAALTSTRTALIARATSKSMSNCS